MSDLDRYLSEEVVEKAAKDLYEQWVTRDNERRMFAPMWDSLESAKFGWLRDARITLEAAAPLIAAQALRELRDYLAEPRRVWFGDLGVRVALDIDDPRSHLALSAYLDLRADQIEQGGQP